MPHCRQEKSMKEKLEYIGRVFEDESGIIFMNWTCSGVRFEYSGRILMADLEAVCGREVETDEHGNPLSKEFRKTWPYAAVFLDDAEEPFSVFEVNERQKNYLLYASEEAEKHIVTLIKLTENEKGKLGIRKIWGDGEISQPPERDTDLRMEFIGDSITCGFGNMTQERDRVYYADEQNGWLTYAALAGRMLNADVQFVSFSGIAVTKGLHEKLNLFHSMPELYPYTDRLMEEKEGKAQDFQKWDFKNHPRDIIVINLGTNDPVHIQENGEEEKGVALFEQEYYDFLKMIRTLNGNNTWIICTLGSMDYYLYDNIKKVAERFAVNEHDERILTFKYGRIRVSEGYGAIAHPSLATHERMAGELVGFIRKIPEILRQGL